jgi:hypothetical protein
MEYDYAASIGIPVLGFIKDNIESLPVSASEKSEKGRKKLEIFRQKVLSRTCRKYGTAVELGLSVMKSLMSEARIRPRIGWVRADQARSEEDEQRERQLVNDLQEASQTIESLQRQLRDVALLGDEIPYESLAQGDDIIELDVTYTDESKKFAHTSVSFTWDEIFKLIGPRIYGYIVRRGLQGQDYSYPFQDSIEDHIRTKISDRTHNRKIKLNQSQIDAIIIQYKELGLVRFQENEKDDGEVFRGVTLTERGEKHLTRINTRRRHISTEKLVTRGKP